MVNEKERYVIHMKDQWSLEALYHGYEDPKFLEDLNRLETVGDLMNDLSNRLTEIEEKDAVSQILDLMEELMLLQEKLDVYCSLVQSACTTDSQSASYLGQINQKLSNTAKPITIFHKYLAKVENISKYAAMDERVKAYDYLLKNLKEDSKHLLNDDVEEVIAKMSITGANAWSELQSYLTSIVKVDYEQTSVTLSEIRNKAYDADAGVRKAAYEAELACYEKIKDAVCYSLNSIKSQVITISQLRGYESPLAEVLHKSHMKKETLDALMTAIKEYLPKFHEYMRRKAKMLGSSDGLAWYDLFAPIGKSSRTFTKIEAKEYLLKHFNTFAPDLAQMVERAFDEEWIDFYPREGKVGGAFCCNIQSLKQSRILTNFDGSLSDVVTLAHELGHAYHNQNIHEHRILNNDYSMPVAETASTFNENVIMNAAINEAEGMERMALIEGQLQDLNQIICDIYSRFLFESKVFEKRSNSFMFADSLCEIMTEAQKEAYGDGLNPNYRHPYMWVCKGHYYSGTLSFYNFPYAFGGLFARGLYAKYQEEGEAFLPKYKALLHATPVSDVEEVAGYAGIDLTDVNFWRNTLETIAKQIDEFIELSKLY